MSLSTSFTVAPNFSLPDLSGKTVSLWDYKDRQPVVLLFAAAADAWLLHEFARRHPDYVEAGAAVLALLPTRPDQEDWPFPVLLDSAGRYAARQVKRAPAVWVLDSFNEVSARFEGVTADDLSHDRILNAVAEVELRCPECGAPEWPQRDQP